MVVYEPTNTWRSRIVRHADVSPASLVAHPDNWRVHDRHQTKMLADLLDRVGWVRPVIVNEPTGRMVDGHLRVALALERDEPTVPVVYVTLDDVEERQVLAGLDPIATLAATDSAALMALAGAVAQHAPDQVELLALVQSLSGSTPQAETPAPTQEQIDERQDEMEHAFEDRHIHTHEVVCPQCGSEFGFAP